jgi:transposase
MFTHFIGVDISKDTLDFQVLHHNQTVLYTQQPNRPGSIKQLFKQLKQLPDFDWQRVVFCMEHTGIYCQHLLNQLWQNQAHVWLESSRQIKQSLGLQRGKSDRVDAMRIAQYAYRFRDQVKLWKPRREVIETLRYLLTMRARLIRSKSQLTVPLKEAKAFMPKNLVKLEQQCFRRTIKSMQADLKKIDEQITSVIKNDEQLGHLFQVVKSVDGVGDVVAAHVIVTTNEFKDFTDARKYACHTGVVPFEHSSGSSVRKKDRVSHLANKTLKTLFHLAAMSAIQIKGELQQYFKRKVAEGKNKMSVINAVRNKLISRIFAVVKRNEPYQKRISPTLV